MEEKGNLNTFLEYFYYSETGLKNMLLTSAGVLLPMAGHWILESFIERYNLPTQITPLLEYATPLTLSFLETASFELLYYFNRLPLTIKMSPLMKRIGFLLIDTYLVSRKSFRFSFISSTYYAISRIINTPKPYILHI